MEGAQGSAAAAAQQREEGAAQGTHNCRVVEGNRNRVKGKGGGKWEGKKQHSCHKRREADENGGERRAMVGQDDCVGDIAANL